jgi:hemerythrin superfamily protein
MVKLLIKLKQDHERIFRKMDALVAVTPERRREMFKELQQLLVGHMLSEEECIYTHVTHPGHNHHEIKDLLQRLNLLANGSNWYETYRYFRNAVIVHCKAEEADLFLKVAELPRDKLNLLYKCYQATQREVGLPGNGFSERQTTFYAGRS